MLAYAEAEAENLIRENLNVVLALVDALVASPNDKLTGEQVDAVIESAIDRERHLTFEMGRRADWAGVLENAVDFAAGLESSVQTRSGAAGSCRPKADMAQQIAV
jgi:hypothetical protein